MDYQNLKRLSYNVILPVGGTKLSPKKQNGIKKNDLYVLNDNDIEEVKNLCIQNVPFWNNFTHEDMEVILILPILTNQVFRVILKTETNLKFPYKSLFVKRTTLFNTLIYNDDLQYQVSKMFGDNNCGPKVIGKFGDYTIQEWLEGSSLCRTSIPYPSTITCIARALANFHKKGTEFAPKEWDRTPFALKRMELWSQHLEKHKNLKLDIDYNELFKNIDIYKKVIKNHVKNNNSIANSVMFCHNDLYFTNMLDVQQGIYILDFDYSGFNYIGWEIANFFHKTDYEFDEDEKVFRLFDDYEIPNEMKSLFVSVYLSQLLDKNILPTDNTVKEFLDSAEVHMLGVNLFWTLWGIIMTDKPTYELGQHLEFFDYSKFHYDHFKMNLKKLIEEKKLGF